METVQHEDGAAKDVDGAQDGGVMAWRNAANPGVATSRMILFIPMGFILGGATSPLMEQSLWVRYFAHVRVRVCLCNLSSHSVAYFTDVRISPVEPGNRPLHQVGRAHARTA